MDQIETEDNKPKKSRKLISILLSTVLVLFLIGGTLFILEQQNQAKQESEKEVFFQRKSKEYLATTDSFKKSADLVITDSRIVLLTRISRVQTTLDDIKFGANSKKIDQYESNPALKDSMNGYLASMLSSLGLIKDNMPSKFEYLTDNLIAIQKASSEYANAVSRLASADVTAAEIDKLKDKLNDRIGNFTRDYYSVNSR